MNAAHLSQGSWRGVRQLKLIVFLIGFELKRQLVFRDKPMPQTGF